MTAALPKLVSQGLSPRVRGNRHCGSLFPPTQRSIPACTGEPDAYLNAFAQKKVYPRVYGGTLPTDRSDHVFIGLSPRVRGNLLPYSVGPWYDGSIPACTGEPLVSLSAGRGHTVYPRVYGGTNFLVSWR